MSHTADCGGIVKGAASVKQGLMGPTEFRAVKFTAHVIWTALLKAFGPSTPARACHKTEAAVFGGTILPSASARLTSAGIKKILLTGINLKSDAKPPGDRFFRRAHGDRSHRWLARCRPPACLNILLEFWRWPNR